MRISLSLVLVLHTAARLFVELDYHELLDKWDTYRKETPNLVEVDAAAGLSQ